MSKYHAVSSGMVTRQALPSITRQRGTTTGSANLMLYGAGKTTVSNNTTFIDSSANAFTITRFGDTVQSGFNPFSQASSGSGYFDGTGDYLSIADNAAFDVGSGDFTIEGWIYLTTSGGGVARWIIGQTSASFTASTTSFIFGINTTNKLLGAVAVGSTFTNCASTASVSANAWVHVAFVRSGASLATYINGTQDGTASISTSTINNSANQIAVGRAGEYNAEYLTGYISNLRVVKGTAVYTSNFTPPTSPLTAITNTSLLLLTDNYSIVNSTSTNLPVTINGNTTISTAQFPTGMSSSMYFDGVGDYATTATNSAFAFGTGAFTVECYFYRTANATNNPAIFCTTTNNLNIFFNNAGDIGVYTITNFFYTSANTALNTWYHFAIVRESSQSTKIYTFTETNNYATMGFIVANGPGLTNDFKGYISNMRVCKGTALYTANFTPPSLPMSTTVTVPNFVTNNIYGVNQIP
jgi:hypothetical protein